MTTHMLTAMYESRADAERARQNLGQLGIPMEHASIVDAESSHDTPTRTEAGEGDGPGLWTRIKVMFGAEEDQRFYEEAMRRGTYLLSAEVDESEADRAASVLEQSGAIDLDTREDEWRRQDGNEGAREASTTTPGENAAMEEERIPIVEERMRVGKRQVGRGSVRVRSYIVEEPVHEQVRLREERAEIERRPVNQPLEGAPGDDLLRERSVEVTETSEEPVVDKQAVVTEEVGIRKRAEERVEDVDETLRHTEVEVDDERVGEPKSKRRGERDQPTRRH